MNSTLRWLRRRLVTPLLHTQATAPQVAWGAGVGMFLALLPVVGQLYLLPPLWAGSRYLLRRTFHLPVAGAMVVLINPPLKVLTFYLYLITGNAILQDFGYRGMEGGFGEFRGALFAETGDWITAAVHAGGVALRRFGMPIVVGGLPWAIAGGALAFGAAWGTIYHLRWRARRGDTAASPAAEPAPLEGKSLRR